MSVPRLLVQTESSVIASQSGPPLIPLASILYWASGIRYDMGACTPGTPGFWFAVCRGTGGLLPESDATHRQQSGDQVPAARPRCHG